MRTSLSHRSWRKSQLLLSSSSNALRHTSGATWIFSSGIPRKSHNALKLLRPIAYFFQPIFAGSISFCSTHGMSYLRLMERSQRTSKLSPLWAYQTWAGCRSLRNSRQSQSSSERTPGQPGD